MLAQFLRQWDCCAGRFSLYRARLGEVLAQRPGYVLDVARRRRQGS